MFNVTSRCRRLIRESAKIASSAKRMTMTPIDLFVGGLCERTGVLGELFLRGGFDVENLKKVAMQLSCKGEALLVQPFEMAVSQETLRVLSRADGIRLSYNQVFINEGHLFSALLEHDEVCSLLRFSNTGITASDIEKIVCSPRDMTVQLRGFDVEGDSRIGNLVIRRAISSDYGEVIDFVREEFGDRWVRSVKHGFEQEHIPIFVAISDRVRGFACYDVVRMKRGTFGPMGTSIACRERGVGKTLLHHCLSDMQRMGYDYAVINNAGPIEFYEKACGAVVIPFFDCETSLHSS